METITITVLDPKVKETIKEWEEQKLITIEKKEIEKEFWKTVDEIREVGKKYPISLEEITKEVEKVRQERYDCLLYTSPSPRDS